MYRTPGIQKGPVDSHTRRLGRWRGWGWDGGGRRRASYGAGRVGVRGEAGGLSEGTSC